MSVYGELSRREDLRWVLLAAVALLALGTAAQAMVRTEAPAAAAPAAPEAPALPAAPLPATPAPADGRGGGAADDAPAVRVRAALIGGPTAAVNLGFGLTELYRYGKPYAGVDTAEVGLLAAPTIEGHKTTHDTAAGLTTVLGPDEATIERIFGGAVRTAPEVLGLQRAPGGAAGTWGAPRVELLWPEDRPQYFLEQQAEPDLYRRIELRQKEGYAVTVRPSGTLAELTATVELVKNTLTGGKYDETIRAFVGKPTLVQHLLEQVVPLTPAEPVLLVWQPEAKVAAAQRDRALTAQQMANVAAAEEQAAKATAQRDLAAAAYAEAIRTRTPDHPRVRALEQQLAELEKQLADARGGGAPAWAVGTWEVRAIDPGGADELLMAEVKANGELVVELPEEAGAQLVAVGLDGNPPVSSEGQVRCRATFEGDTITFTGWLHRDGTGAGTARDEDGEEVVWTAKRVRGVDETGLEVEGGITGYEGALLRAYPVGPAAAEVRFEEVDGLLAPTTARAGAPQWAVGTWEVKHYADGEPDNLFTVEVKANGQLTAEVPEDGGVRVVAVGLDGNPPVDPTGKVRCRVSYEGKPITFTGWVHQDGTGVGTARAEGETIGWTAKRVGGAGQAEAPVEVEWVLTETGGGGGAPPWAVGTWEVRIPGEGDEAYIVEVQADASITVRVPAKGVPVLAAEGVGGRRPIDASGKVGFQVTHEGTTVRISGRVTPDGTGTGVARIGDEAAKWIGTRVGGPNQGQVDAGPPTEVLKQTKARFEKELAELQDALLTGRPEDSKTARVQRRIQELERQLTELDAGRVPGWAVGGWDVHVGEQPVRRPIVLTHRGEVAPLTPNFIVEGAAGETVIDPTGRVQLEVRFAGEPGAFTGQVKPDGTALGVVRLKDGATANWTAERIGEGIGEVVVEAAPAGGAIPWAPTPTAPEQATRYRFRGIDETTGTPAGAVQYRLRPGTGPTIWANPQPGATVDYAPLAETAVRSYYGTTNRVGQTVTDGGKTFRRTLNLTANPTFFSYQKAQPTTAPTGVAVLLELVAPEQARAAADDAACRRNLKQLALGCHMYAEDHDGRLPARADPEGFRDELLPYVGNDRSFFVCPAKPNEPGYVFNAILAGARISEIRDAQHTPMLWDAGARPGGAKASPGIQSSRHNGGDNVAYLDGHCSRLEAKGFGRFHFGFGPALPAAATR